MQRCHKDVNQSRWSFGDKHATSNLQPQSNGNILRPGRVKQKWSRINHILHLASQRVALCRQRGSFSLRSGFCVRLDDTFVCCFMLLTAGTKQISYNDTAQVLKGESVEKILLVSACRSQQSSKDVVILIRWRFKTLGKQQAAGNSD